MIPRDVHEPWRVGFAASRIEIDERTDPAIGMFGWGDPTQKVEGTRLPLFARAMVVSVDDEYAAYACLDVGLVSTVVRDGVFERLQSRVLGPHNVMITATHTHSGPGGLTPYSLLHSTDGGYSEANVERVAAAAARAIAAALERLEPARLSVAHPFIPADEPLAFNRSLPAYRQNPDITPGGEPEESVRRFAPTLIARRPDGGLLGLVQWVGVHPTAFHADSKLLDPDVHGRAAARLEAELAGDGGAPVVIFAQETSGDVTPNYRWNRERGCCDAPSSDVEHAEDAAAILGRSARRALDIATPLDAGACGGRLMHVDMGSFEVAADLAGQRHGVRTRGPWLNLAVILGTSDGPGPFAAAAPWVQVLARAAETLRPGTGLGVDISRRSSGAALGVGDAARLLRAMRHEPSVRYLSVLSELGLLDDVPLLPSVVPVQLLRLGGLTVLGLPCEPTTVAGQRLRTELAACTQGAFVVQGCANDYAMYCSTEQEYAEQSYEAACTLYGRHTTAAYRTAARFLAELPNASPHDTPIGPVIPRADLPALRRQREAVAAILDGVEHAAPMSNGNGPVRPPPASRGAGGARHPGTEREVSELLRWARRHGRRVRVIGSAHSEAAAIADAGDLLVQLDRLDRIEVDDARREVTVGAGVRFGGDARDPSGVVDPSLGLCVALERRGWALPSLGGVSHQTVGGFLMTGSAGGSFTRSLAEAVVAIRFVDGHGEVHEVLRDRDEEVFSALGCSLGLLGVVTAVTFRCVASYDLVGDERPVALSELRLPAELLAARAFARALWFPQPGVGRAQLWSAGPVSAMYPGSPVPRELPPARTYEPFPRIAGRSWPTQAAASVALTALDRWPAWLDRIAPSVRSRAYDAFIPSDAAPAATFRARWHRALPMDDEVDDRILPVRFSELWFDAEDGAEVIERLERYTADGGWTASGTFAWELYPGAPSPFLLAPGYGRRSLRLNPFFYGRSARDPMSFFEPIAALLDDLRPRLHWGKLLRRDPAATAASVDPEVLERFERQRRRFDPDGIFLTHYWRAHLGLGARVPEVERAAVPEEEPPTARPPNIAPLLFRLRPVRPDYVLRAQQTIELRAVIHADRDDTFEALTNPAGAHPWMPHFRASRWLSGGRPALGVVYEEEFSFLSLRLRVVAYEYGHDFTASILATSLPLATRMAQRFEAKTIEGGSTAVRWRIAYDPLPIVAPTHPVVQPAFRAFFQQILDAAKRHLEASSPLHSVAGDPAEARDRDPARLPKRSPTDTCLKADPPASAD